MSSSSSSSSSASPVSRGEGYIPVKMTERLGDLFQDDEAQVFAHCVSRDLAMGAGIATSFRDNYGRLDEVMLMMVPVGKTAWMNYRSQRRLQALKYSSSSSSSSSVPKAPGKPKFAIPQFVCHMVTKKRFFEKPTMDSLELCIRELKEHMGRWGMTKLAIPRLGCGLDKLDWDDVKAMIRRVFSEHDYRFNGLGPIYITVWALKASCKRPSKNKSKREIKK